jgi:hypothetical protein
MLNKYNFIILIIIIIGCTNPFAPKLTDSDFLSSSFLTDQKNPKDVLSNFRYAYIFKDSLIYSEVIDSSFIFISKNYATTPPTDLIWGRDVDLTTTAKLFRHFRDIRLSWGDTLSSKRDLSSAEIELTFLLTFDDGQEIPTVKGIALFNFQKKSSGIWSIVRWEEL